MGKVRRMPMKWKMGTDRAARTKMASQSRAQPARSRA